MNFIRKIDGETTKKAVATTEEIIKILDGYDYDFACYVLKLTQQAIKQGATVESHKATRYILAGYDANGKEIYEGDSNG